MGILLMALKMVGILLLAAVLLLAVGLWLLAPPSLRAEALHRTGEGRRPAGGPLSDDGKPPCGHGHGGSAGDWKRFFACYPAGLPEGRERYPAVVMVNGTGVRASKYPALFRHLASWGLCRSGQ